MIRGRDRKILDRMRVRAEQVDDMVVYALIVLGLVFGFACHELASRGKMQIEVSNSNSVSILVLDRNGHLGQSEDR